MSEIEIPEKPMGIGSIIRVVFKAPGVCEAEAFYVGVSPGLWSEYGGEDVYGFTWRQMLEIIEYDEAEIFEVVYEGFGATERNDAFGHHVKDWIWREAL